MNKVEKLSLKLITEAINDLYGYDFSQYSKASLYRRLVYHKTKNQLSSLADMIPILLRDKSYFYELLADISVTVTEMFRDPEFYKYFKKHSHS